MMTYWHGDGISLQQIAFFSSVFSITCTTSLAKCINRLRSVEYNLNAFGSKGNKEYSEQAAVAKVTAKTYGHGVGLQASTRVGKNRILSFLESA